jgi:hypothetical protein
VVSVSELRFAISLDEVMATGDRKGARVVRGKVAGTDERRRETVTKQTEMLDWCIRSSILMEIVDVGRRRWHGDVV